MRYLLLLLSLLILAPAAPAVYAQSAAWQDTSSRIDNLFANWDSTTAGGVLTIQRRDSIIYNRALGMADLEHGIPNTPATVFEAGSVSKQFTAAAIFLLAMDGKLSLDDKVRKYFPELPAVNDKITIRHLIHHTSGLRDWGSVASISGWWRGTRNYTQAHVLDILTRQQALNFPAGDQYSYCNSGYNLMAMIVAKVSGQSFAEFCQKRIFEPAGMTHSQWRDDYRKIVPNRAIAYNQQNGSYLQDMPFENAHGNGGLLTTTADLLRWSRQYKSPIIGGDALLRLQLQQGKLNNGATIHYAGGLSIGEVNSFREISHSGSTAGYRAWLAYYPEPDLTVAFLSNEANVNPAQIGAQVAGMLLGTRPQTAPAINASAPMDNALAGKAGLYHCLRNDDLIELEAKDGALRLKTGQPLVPTTGNTFLQGDTRLEFSNNQFIAYYSNGDSATYLKKTPVKPTTNELQAFTGTYHSSEAEVSFQLDVKDGKLRCFRRPDNYFFLTPLYQDTFRTGSGSLVRFRRDASGKITGFGYSVARASGVWFERQK